MGVLFEGDKVENDYMTKLVDSEKPEEGKDS